MKVMMQERVRASSLNWEQTARTQRRKEHKPQLHLSSPTMLPPTSTAAHLMSRNVSVHASVASQGSLSNHHHVPQVRSLHSSRHTYLPATSCSAFIYKALNNTDTESSFCLPERVLNSCSGPIGMLKNARADNLGIPGTGRTQRGVCCLFTGYDLASRGDE